MGSFFSVKVYHRFRRDNAYLSFSEGEIVHIKIMENNTEERDVTPLIFLFLSLQSNTLIMVILLKGLRHSNVD